MLFAKWFAIPVLATLPQASRGHSGNRWNGSSANGNRTKTANTFRARVAMKSGGQMPARLTDELPLGQQYGATVRVSRQLVDSCLWFTENPSFHIIELLDFRLLADEFLVISTLLQFAKFLTKTAITAVSSDLNVRLPKWRRKWIRGRWLKRSRTNSMVGGPISHEPSYTRSHSHTDSGTE
jgi:hypothetical protein